MKRLQSYGANCPDPTNVCVPIPEGEEGFVCLFRASARPYGAECQFTNDCDTGLFCAVQQDVPNCEAARCCSEFCDVNQPNTCAGLGNGQQCLPWEWDGPAPAELAHIGGCGIP